MPDFRGAHDPSLDAIRRTDSFVDALAGGRPVVPHDAAEAELGALLGGWRDELRWPPATGLISEADAIAAFNAGRAEKRSGPDPQRWTATQKRNRRGLSVIGASAAAVLCIGGFGAVVAGAGPGDALYGVRTMLFGAPKQVRDDQVGLAAKTELNEVQDLISQGDWQQAEDKLVAVSTQVATIDDQQQKQELLEQFNDLSAKVVGRDPAATAAPGIVYTVPPSSAELVPAVVPTSTPSAPALTESATPPTTTTSETAAVTSGAPSSPTTTPTATPTTPPSTQSAQTTTPTSAAPPATTDAPALTTTPTVPTTPVSTAAEAPSTAGATAQPTEPAGSQTPASPASPSPAQSEASVPPTDVVTTTVQVPAPVG